MNSVRKMFTSKVTNLPKNAHTHCEIIIEQMKFKPNVNDVISIITNCEKATEDLKSIEKYNDFINSWLNYTLSIKSL